MFCPKCGRQIPDGSKFCTLCGEKLAAVAPVVTVENPKAAVATVKPAPVKVGGKVDVKKFLPLIAGVVGIVLLVVLVSALFSGSGSLDYAYLADGRYYLLSDLKDPDALELAASKSDTEKGSMLRFSEDGKYVYYFTKYDYYNGTGTLCRARLNKLSDNTDKNEKYIDIIATNVTMNYTILKDNSVVYKTGDNALYYYDGKDVALIAKGVSSYAVDDSENLTYLSRENDALYGLKLKDLDSREKLDSNVYAMVDTEDLENVLYLKEDEDYTYSLYQAGIGKEAQKLDEGLEYFAYLNDSFVYVLSTGNSVSLYDYVQDNYSSDEYEYIRERLQDPDHNREIYTLKRVAEGKVTVISESVLDCENINNALLYNTIDMITEKISIDQVDSWYDVDDLMDLRPDAQNYVLLASGNVVRFSASAADALYLSVEQYDVDLHFTEKYAYIEEEEGALSQAEIKDGVIGSFTLLSDEGYVFHATEDTLYYATNIYENNGYTYCELYACENGKTKRLARDVMSDGIYLYEDDTILAYTDRRSGGYELTMINAKGESKLIAENVTQFIRVDKKTLLFISDGDLFVYNGKSKSLLATNVDILWTKESMELKEYLYLY